MTLGEKLPPAVEQDGRRRPDANRVVQAYRAMATKDELQILREQEHDETHASNIVNGISKLLVQRISQAYSEIKKQAPRDFSPASTIYVNTMLDNLRHSKVTVESSNFASWRKKCEGQGTSRDALKRPPPADDEPAADESPRSRSRRDQPRPHYSGDDSGDESDGSDGSEDDDDSEGLFGKSCSPPRQGEWQETAIDCDDD